MDNKKLISVSDINAWLYCSRKVYLQKICGLQTIPNRNMAIGRLKHSIIENFSKAEEKFLAQIDKDYEKVELLFLYEDFVKTLANQVFAENSQLINKFMIDKEDILKKVMRDFQEDIKLRIASIKEVIAKGHLKDQIWKNLDTIYLSEIKVESELLGLKGRVDRVLLSRKDNSVIPFEIKSREGKIFPSDELQLTAYAMLLEDKYKTQINKGYVEVGNNRQEIEMSDSRRKEVLKIADEIRNLNEDNPPPMQSNFNKCNFCEFKEECGKI